MCSWVYFLTISATMTCANKECSDTLISHLHATVSFLLSTWLQHFQNKEKLYLGYWEWNRMFICAVHNQDAVKLYSEWIWVWWLKVRRWEVSKRVRRMEQWRAGQQVGGQIPVWIYCAMLSHYRTQRLLLPDHTTLHSCPTLVLWTGLSAESTDVALWQRVGVSVGECAGVCEQVCWSHLCNEVISGQAGRQQQAGEETTCQA